MFLKDFKIASVIFALPLAIILIFSLLETFESALIILPLEFKVILSFEGIEPCIFVIFLAVIFILVAELIFES